MRLNIAVEIGENFFKIAAAGPPAIGRSRLANCIVEPIASFSDEQITKAISEALRKNRLRAKTTTLCLPRNSATVRNLHLPSQDPKELSQIIDLHIGRIVPYKKEEMLFNYQALGTDDLGYTKEILAIVHKDVIKKYSKILEAAGLYIDKINLSSYGAWQWGLSNYAGEITQADLFLLLDVDSNFADFIIFNRDNLLFSRSINLDLKGQMAEPEIIRIIGEVRQSLVIFQNEEINKKPAKIFLSGAAAVKGLEKAFEAEFESPVKMVPSPCTPELLKANKRDMPENVSVTAVSELILESSEKRISFTLPEIQIRKALKEKTRELVLVGTFLIYFFTVSMAFLWGRLFNQQGYLRMLNERNKAVEKDIVALVSLSKRLETVRSFSYLQKIPLILVSEIYKITPPEIAVTLISVDESYNITLRGQGTQLSDVFKFITSLENSPYLKDVQTKSTRTRKVRDRDVTDFELAFRLENAPPPPKGQGPQKGKQP